MFLLINNLLITSNNVLVHLEAAYPIVCPIQDIQRVLIYGQAVGVCQSEIPYALTRPAGADSDSSGHGENAFVPGRKNTHGLIAGIRNKNIAS